MNKKRLEYLFAILVIIAVIVALFFLLRKPEDGQEQILPDEQSPVVVDQDSFPNEPNSFENPIILPETTVRGFVERFGSFSSESDFGNVEDVLPLVTTGLANELQQLTQTAIPASAYYGVSTRVIAMQSQGQTETEATFLVQTQREEAIDRPANNRVYYQDMEVSLVKEGDTWLVSGYTWLE